MIKVITFNLRCANDVDGNSIDERAPRLKKVLAPLDADLIGFQEVVPRWMEHLEKEYGEAADVLRLLLNARPPRCPSLRLCLHGDGLCSLTDGEELRMEYVDETGEGIISLLIGMAPARLFVYDLSGGARTELVHALTEIFSGRVCLYTGEFP